MRPHDAGHVAQGFFACFRARSFGLRAKIAQEEDY
jgi:hypothetical protein